MTSLTGVDPRTGERVGEAIPETTSEELTALLSRAECAHRDATMADPEDRATLLRGLADALDDAGDRVIPLAMQETGLTSQRLAGELARTTSQLRLFADVVLEGSYLDVTIDHGDADAGPAQPELRRIQVPLGPVLVFAASNFPFAFGVVGGDTASALAVGAPVLVKAHWSHPGLSAALADIVNEAVASLGLSSGVFGMVTGEESGRTALQHPTVRACGFTGSTNGGRALYDLAVSRPDPIPFFGELGSINPVVVLPGADAERPAEVAAGFVASVTGSTGQLCTKPGLLFVPRAGGVVAELPKALADSPAGPMLNKRMRDAFVADVADVVARASVQELATSDEPPPEEGFWATPQLLRVSAAAAVADPSLITSEIFGPAAVVVEYDDPAGLLEALAGVGGSLTGTVHASPTDDAQTVLDLLVASCGRIVWNGWPTGVAVGWATHHGGPWPATTAAASTSVGVASVRRWLRPVCFQDVPTAYLPPQLRHPAQVPRREDGLLTEPNDPNPRSSS